MHPWPLPPAAVWVDTHCHLDAPALGAQAVTVRAQARAAGVALCVTAAVRVSAFDAVRQLAHASGDAYALGIHPLCVAQTGAGDDDLALAALDAALTTLRDDPRLVALGEIGLDFFVPALAQEPLRARQTRLYRRQLELAVKHGLPVILHLRRSADAVLQGLRDIGPPGGIAHAFNGSAGQARQFIERGFKLGFGGAFTHPHATRLRALAAGLPLSALVLETDAPDMPPHWLRVSAAARAAGQPQPPNTPAELPRIGAHLAALRGLDVPQVRQATTANALAALPGAARLLAGAV